MTETLDVTDVSSLPALSAAAPRPHRHDVRARSGARQPWRAVAFPLGRPRRRPRARGRGVHAVLVVDDSAHTREMYSEYLRHRGFDVVTAPDGDAAIELAVGMRPSLIVMDVAMPRLSGISAAHHLKHHPRTRDIPIIVLTGYAFRAIQEGALEAGVDVFLTKPCLPEDLEQHVRRLLDKSPDGR